MLCLVVPGYTKFTQVLPGLLMQVFQGKPKIGEFWHFGPSSVFSYARFSGLVHNLEDWVSSEYFLCVFVCKVL